MKNRKKPIRTIGRHSGSNLRLAAGIASAAAIASLLAAALLYTSCIPSGLTTVAVTNRCADGIWLEIGDVPTGVRLAREYVAAGATESVPVVKAMSAESLYHVKIDVSGNFCAYSNDAYLTVGAANPLSFAPNRCRVIFRNTNTTVRVTEVFIRAAAAPLIAADYARSAAWGSSLGTIGAADVLAFPAAPNATGANYYAAFTIVSGAATLTSATTSSFAVGPADIGATVFVNIQ
jgi:hypothetical protein